MESLNEAETIKKMHLFLFNNNNNKKNNREFSKHNFFPGHQTNNPKPHRNFEILKCSPPTGLLQQGNLNYNLVHCSLV